MKDWKPKQGEMILISDSKEEYSLREFIGMTATGKYMCWMESRESTCPWKYAKENKPEPVMEKRWQMLKDYKRTTLVTNTYCNQEFKDENYPDWYKGNMIEVEVPQ